MALRLKNLFTENGIEFLNDSYSNQLFVILPNNMVKEIEKKYIITYIGKHDENRSVIRFVTSWATTNENVDSFIKDFNENYKFIK